MKYISFRDDGKIVLNDNGECGILPINCIELSDANYYGLANESLIYQNGTIIPNPNPVL